MGIVIPLDGDAELNAPVRAAKNQFEILPLEKLASDCLVEAVRLFLLAGFPQAEAFMKAIHRCQTSLGSLRFFHELNTQYRAINPSASSFDTDADSRIERLLDWGHERYIRVPCMTNPEKRQVVKKLFQAYNALVRLTAQFPEQHNFDEFQEGLETCLQILQK